jgi:hypothetical protein
MDATRARRTRDRARQGWYARHRQWRFARYLGFVVGPEAPFTPATVGQPALKVRTTVGPVPGLGPIHTSAPASDRHCRSLIVAAG